MDSRQKNKDPNAHLYALMDFAQDIFQKMVHNLLLNYLNV